MIFVITFFFLKLSIILYVPIQHVSLFNCDICWFEKGTFTDPVKRCCSITSVLIQVPN